MIISIDHGNKLIKTDNHVFTSGLLESSSVPPIKSNTIFYEGKYYTLSNKRIPYLRNKTDDRRFYILTLIAVAMELDSMNLLEEGKTRDITLLEGLPPSHYGKQYESFEKYFQQNSGKAEFLYRDKPVSLNITGVHSYPQAYAAAMSEYARIKDYSKVIVVDIGGYTLDYICINNGMPDLSLVDSLEDGVITMYNHIISKVNSAMDISLSEADIDAIVREYNASDSPVYDLAAENKRPKIVIDRKAQDMVFSEAQAFTNDLLGKLRERKIDLSSNMFVFVGGGSSLLKYFIEQSEKVKNLMFIENIKANVEGYKVLYAASTGE
jgi:plasmid segregation protein ParM